FLVKVARGRPNHSGDPIDLAYWVDRNLNDVKDDRILRHQDAVAERVAALRQDEEIARLHDAGVAWRKSQISTLMTASESFYMFARLAQMPSTKILPMVKQRALLHALGVMRRAEMQRKSTS
ncbi:MAG: glycosyltransferase family 2 protein, partial [Pseudomonadota bacterium]